MNPNAPVFEAPRQVFEGPAFIVPKLSKAPGDHIPPPPAQPAQPTTEGPLPGVAYLGPYSTTEQFEAQGLGLGLGVPPPVAKTANGRPVFVPVPHPQYRQTFGSAHHHHQEQASSQGEGVSDSTVVDLGMPGEERSRVLIVSKGSKGKTAGSRLQASVSGSTRLSEVFEAFRERKVVRGIQAKDLHYYVNGHKAFDTSATLSSLASKGWLELDGSDVFDVLLAGAYAHEEVFNSLDGALDYYRARNKKLHLLEKFVVRLEKASRDQNFDGLQADSPQAKKLLDLVKNLSESSSSAAAAEKKPTSKKEKKAKKKEPDSFSGTPVSGSGNPATGASAERETKPAASETKPSKKKSKAVSKQPSAANGENPPDDLATFLTNIRCEKYLDLFAEEDIHSVHDLLIVFKDTDLRGMGLPIGPRRRLQTALDALDPDHTELDDPETADSLNDLLDDAPPKVPKAPTKTKKKNNKKSPDSPTLSAPSPDAVDRTPLVDEHVQQQHLLDTHDTT